MAMYFYASKISAIACGTRCRQTVLQKSRGQRDRDKHNQHRHRGTGASKQTKHNSSNNKSCSSGHSYLHDGTDDEQDCNGDAAGGCEGSASNSDDEVLVDKNGVCIRMKTRSDNKSKNEFFGSGAANGAAADASLTTSINGNGGSRIYGGETAGTTETSLSTLATTGSDGIRYRRRFSEQLDVYDIELGFQKIEVSLVL